VPPGGTPRAVQREHKGTRSTDLGELSVSLASSRRARRHVTCHPAPAPALRSLPEPDTAP